MVSLTSMALRRADCSQAWPSARPQKMALAREYSRRLGRSSSSTSNAEKFSREFQRLMSANGTGLVCARHRTPSQLNHRQYLLGQSTGEGEREYVREAWMASSEKASISEAS